MEQPSWEGGRELAKKWSSISGQCWVATGDLWSHMSRDSSQSDGRVYTLQNSKWLAFCPKRFVRTQDANCVVLECGGNGYIIRNTFLVCRTSR